MYRLAHREQILSHMEHFRCFLSVQRNLAVENRVLAKLDKRHDNLIYVECKWDLLPRIDYCSFGESRRASGWSYMSRFFALADHTRSSKCFPSQFMCLSMLMSITRTIGKQFIV